MALDEESGSGGRYPLFSLMQTVRAAGGLGPPCISYLTPAGVCAVTPSCRDAVACALASAERGWHFRGRIPHSDGFKTKSATTDCKALFCDGHHSAMRKGGLTLADHRCSERTSSW
jgi:hypothetical protein